MDRRTTYTRMVIKQAILKFLSEKPLSQITIKEICLEANLNRATFYRNYKDLYDVFEEMENDLIHEAFPNGTTSYDVTQLLEVMYNNQIFYKEFFSHHLESRFIQQITDEMKVTFSNILKDNNVYDEENYNYYFHYAVYGATGLLKEWFSNGCVPPPKEFSELLLKMCYNLFSL